MNDFEIYRDILLYHMKTSYHENYYLWYTLAFFQQAALCLL